MITALNCIHLRFFKGITTLVKSDGHMPFTYISLHSSTNSFVSFAPSTFQNSAGIPSGPIALPTFSASIAFVTSLSRITGLFEFSSTVHQAPIQFPSLHSEVFHSCHTESQYTPSICSLSLLVLSIVFLSHLLLPHLYSVSCSFSSTVQ